MSAPTGPRRDRGDHGEWDALAVGWALSALESDDEERFAAHLTDCDRCPGTVRESLQTVGDLAYTLPDEAPPPSLKTRIMAAVAAEPRRAPSAGPAGAPPAEQDPDEGEWPLRAQLAEPETPSGPDAPLPDWFARPGQADLPGPQYRPGDGRPPAGFAGGPPGDLPGAGPGQFWDHSGRRSPERSPGERLNGGPPGDRFKQPLADEPGGRPDGAVPSGGEPGLVLDFSRPGVDRALPAGRGRHAAPDDEVDHPAGPPSTVVPLEPRRRRSWVSRIAVAAAVALIAALGAWNLQLRSEQDDLRQIVAQREVAIRQLTTNGPARVAALVAPDQPSAARRATVVVRGDRIEIITETLGASAGDVRYWLWTLKCDTPTPTDLKPIRGFDVPRSRFSVRSIGSDPAFADAPCFAISEEIGSGTPTAPRAVVAVGQPK